MKSKIENNWKLLQSVNDWIKVSDTKAIAILGTQSIFFAFIISGTVSKDFHAQNTTFSLTLAAIAISLNLISVLFAFLSIHPSLKLKGGISPLYFGSIANNFKNSKEYSNFCRNRIDDDSQLLSELEAQIYINSEIAWEKFCNVTRSIRLLTISLFIWSGFTFCMLFGNGPIL